MEHRQILIQSMENSKRLPLIQLVTNTQTSSWRSSKEHT